jgi:periplasmic protein CpxP/Spy
MMKAWIKRSVMGFVGATVIAIGTLGVAGCSHHGGHGAINEADSTKFQTKMVERVGIRLALDENQKQKLTVLAGKLQEQRKDVMGEKGTTRSEFASVIAGATFDKAKAQKLIDDKTSAVKGKSPEVVSAAADFYDSLNATQQSQVREFMDNGKGRRWSRS